MKKKIKIFTATIACIKGDIINSYTTTCSIRTPCAFEHDVEVRIFIDVSLSIAPRGTLIVVQLPYRFGFCRNIAHCLQIQSQNTYKVTIIYITFFVFLEEKSHTYKR